MSKAQTNTYFARPGAISFLIVLLLNTVILGLYPILNVNASIWNYFPLAYTLISTVFFVVLAVVNLWYVWMPRPAGYWISIINLVINFLFGLGLAAYSYLNPEITSNFVIQIGKDLMRPTDELTLLNDTIIATIQSSLMLVVSLVSLTLLYFVAKEKKYFTGKKVKIKASEQKKKITEAYKKAKFKTTNKLSGALYFTMSVYLFLAALGVVYLLIEMTSIDHLNNLSYIVHIWKHPYFLGSTFSMFVGVIFIAWLYRSMNNAFARNEKPRRHRPRWGLFAFFIPILNQFKPYQIVKELGAPTKNHRLLIMIDLWWAFWLSANVYAPQGMVAQDTLSFYNSHFMMIFSSTCQIIAGGLLIAIVYKVTQHQSEIKSA